MEGGSLGAYRLESQLGAGGMGTVWLATKDGARVAVKILHPHLLESPGFFKRFLREADIGKSVVHPNVVRTFDCDAIATGGVQHHFLVMEYVEGRTLRGLLDELGRVPEELCRHIGREIAKGLAAIHAAGAVHRDLKPENVLVTRDHVVKVMDLGVARLADEALRLSQSGVFVGSVLYAAPEQFRAPAPRSATGEARSAKGVDEVDGRADLHALGVVLYELATGQHPFRADDFRGVMRRVLDEAPRRCAEINPQLSPFFEEAVHTLLAKKRDGRFASAAEAARVLDEGEASSWWRERARAVRAETRRPLRRIRIPRETAVHGRDAEIARLRALFERATAGDGQVAVIEGEAGIGKSRLVDEFVGVLQREGEDLNFLFGSYPPGGAATASGAFSTAYREQFGEDGCAAWLRETPILVPAFDALLRGETTPSGVEPLTKDSLQTCFVHATRAFAAERTTIVLIDDLHFAPEEGRALFAALAMAVPGHHILLVGTARPGLDEKWLANMDRVGATRVPLARLGPKDLVRLLADTLKSEHLATELAGKIALKSDGNPFFVFEILRGLRDGQFLTKKPDGTWATTRVIEEIQIPSSVLELVNARVADLDDDDRNLLDVAACLGFEFDPLLVARALDLPAVRALQRLARIEKKHRLVRSAGRRLVFDHHQVQEALYAGMPEMLREEYHAAIGAALEAASGAAEKEPQNLDGALCVDLAEHFLRGGQGARALRCLDAALTHLERGWLNDAAARLAARALAVPGLVAGGERCDLLLRMAARLQLLGRQEALDALTAALSLADADGGPLRRATARIALGSCVANLSRHAEAGALVGEAVDLARAAGDRRAEASASLILGNIANTLARFGDAETHVRRSLALSQETGDKDGEAAATINLGISFQFSGRLDEAREQCERGRDLAQRCGNRRWESYATGNLGVVLSTLGRLAEARSQQERKLALAREIGDRRGEATAVANLGVGRAGLGMLAEGQTFLERYLDLAREIGDSHGEVHALKSLGSIRLELGDTAGARRRQEEALALSREKSALVAQGEVLAALSAVADAEGDPFAALRYANDSLDAHRRIGRSDGVADALIEIGDLRRRAGDAEGARVVVEEAVALYREQGRASDIALGLALLACLPGGDAGAAALASAGDLGEHAMRVRHLMWLATHDRAHLDEAKRRLDFLVAHAPPECRGSMIANVRLHREIAAAAKDAGL